MTEKQVPPPGLLSKVVRFVRNPTVSWTDLDAIDADRQGEYSKQILKERVERKRGNDFVRQREFDQLRKLRQRGPESDPRMDDPAARPSFFHSSLTSSDDRAGTLKKIDEIEAQMSQQWWKNEEIKGKGVASQQEGAPLADHRDLARRTDEFARTESSPLREAPVALGASHSLDANVAHASVSAVLGEQSAGRDPFGASEIMAALSAAAHLESMVDVAPALLAQADLSATFVHLPDLEEAAIRFANGDYDGAEASLKEVLAQHAEGEPAQLLEIWRTLFDLYRATGQQDPFEVAAIKFAGRFERSAPLWFSIPVQLGIEEAPSIQLERTAQREFVWNAPPTVTLQTVLALQASLARSASPWKLIWSRVHAIDADAVPSLANEFSRWADQTGQLVFVGVDELRTLLEAQTQSGDREQNPEWWRLRMAALRLMGQPDEFEMVALDYCVTYEVSPPSWLPVRCGYQGDSGADIAADEADSGLRDSRGWAVSSILGGQNSTAVVVDGLMGVIEGDATGALDEVVLQTPADAALRVPCERLIRIDFSAAGSVLNWAAEQQGRGRVVEFVQLHRLAAVFFNVVGISEYGSVLVRHD